MSELGPGWKYLLKVMEYGAALRASEPAYAEAITDALLRAVQGDALTELLLRAVRQDFLLSLAKMAERGELKEGGRRRGIWQRYSWAIIGLHL